jgi:hypothetical protein
MYHEEPNICNFTGFPGVEICGAGKIICINTAEDDLIKKEIQQEQLDDKVDTTRGRTECNCLPGKTTFILFLMKILYILNDSPNSLHINNL